MGAFTHAYESFISPVTNPVSQALAWDSMRLISLEAFGADGVQQLFPRPEVGGKNNRADN
jgi:alcohol dehydrogenase class IV